MNIFMQASENYATYAAYVNSFRSLPSHLDGFKPIQRRLLLCGFNDAGCAKSFVKSARVCGTTIAKYHPHGETSAYSTLVNMVRADDGAFEGHGNFGTQGISAAAMRYTEVRVSKAAKQLWLKLLGEVPTFENDLGVRESTYLPTVIPYALVAGAFGIGVGCMTNIPKFKLKSLFEYIMWLQSPVGQAPKIKINYGKATMTPDILTDGKGIVTYHPKMRWELDDDGRNILVLKEVPPGMDTAEVLQSLFKSEIDSDSVFVRDESTDKLRVIIGRMARTRRISDDQVEKRVKTKFTRKDKINLMWSTPQGPRQEGVVQVITRALQNFEKLHASDTAKRLAETQRELRLYKVAKPFVKSTMKSAKPVTCSALKISSDDYDAWARKALSSLKEYGDQLGIKEVQQKKKDIQNYDLKIRLKEIFS